MDKMNIVKNLLFLQGIIIFAIHFIFSPYPINSIERSKRAIESFIKEYKILNKIQKSKFIIDKDGYNFKIASFGSRVIEPLYSHFFFIIKNYKIDGYDNGLYVISIPKNKPDNFNLHFFDLNKDCEKFFNYMKYSLQDTSLLIFSFKGFTFNNPDTISETIFKKMGAMNYKKAKEGYSYIFVTRKEKENFVPLKEIFSENKLLFVNFKIKL